ncbi:MAG: Do family serine endopeptidase [Paludibacter sp.]|jgi:Do/DeqQ family serine protease|nr:Do family serine endopeptidase [Paludibacter sp.]
MRTNKLVNFAGLVLLIVGVTVATNVIVNRVIKSSSADSTGFSNQPIPASYANFRNVSRSVDTDFTVAAELTVNAVVHVKVKAEVQPQGFRGGDPFFEYFFGPQFRQQQQPQIREGAGSGVIISEDGYIVTNNHVIDKSKEIEVVLNDKRSFTAKVVGADPNTDIALLKIEEKGLPYVIFGSSDSLRIGEWVLAVGNPFNLTSTVTAGIVSAKARSINILNSAMPIESFIQTDAAVNPGNSGGALVNTKGELVGINTAIASSTGAYAGYSFAVPASIVQKVVSDFRRFGVVQRAVLGVSLGELTSELAKEKNIKLLSGAYVAGVASQSAAEKAGIKEGDVITAVNGVAVKTVAELQEQIGRYSPGDKVTVDVVRDNKTLKLKAELKNRQGTTSTVTSDLSIDLLGASFKSVDDKVKSKFGIDYGVEVKSVSRGKFADAGIKAGYIILKINNLKMSSEEDIKTAMESVAENAEENKVLWISGFYPNGKTAYFAIPLTN